MQNSLLSVWVWVWGELWLIAAWQPTLRIVPWPPTFRRSSKALRSSGVIPRKNPLHSCKYATGVSRTIFTIFSLYCIKILYKGVKCKI